MSETYIYCNYVHGACPMLLDHCPIILYVLYRPYVWSIERIWFGQSSFDIPWSSSRHCLTRNHLLKQWSCRQFTHHPTPQSCYNETGARKKWSFNSRMDNLFCGGQQSVSCKHGLSAAAHIYKCNQNIPHNPMEYALQITQCGQP